MRRQGRRRAHGQAMLEFALLAPMLCMLALGCVDIGGYYQDRIDMQAAVRGAARFASINPTTLSASSSAPPNTIQGVLQNEAGHLSIINDNAHITIQYFAVSGSAETLCAQYDQSTNSLTYQGTYNSSSCIAVGNVVRITAVHTWQSKTPMISGMLPLNGTMTVGYSMVIT